jgi:hypothetical protein
MYIIQGNCYQPNRVVISWICGIDTLTNGKLHHKCCQATVGIFGWETQNDGVLYSRPRKPCVIFEKLDVKLDDFDSIQNFESGNF